MLSYMCKNVTATQKAAGLGGRCTATRMRKSITAQIGINMPNLVSKKKLSQLAGAGYGRGEERSKPPTTACIYLKQAHALVSLFSMSSFFFLYFHLQPPRHECTALTKVAHPQLPPELAEVDTDAHRDAVESPGAWTDGPRGCSRHAPKCTKKKERKRKRKRTLRYSRHLS